MDARSLLRAKKAEARIDHPYASYSSAGQLRCSICAIPVKQWEAHLVTKQHRQSVQREREAQAKAAAKKRPSEETSLSESAKRARFEQPQVDEEDEEEEGPSGLPEGFFSSTNKPSVELEPSINGVEEVGINLTLPKATGDAELDDFLASLSEPQPEIEPSNLIENGEGSTKRKPVRASYKETEDAQVSYQAAPVLIGRAEGEEPEEEEEPEESEAEKRARIAQEEREEIMGRLEEEERAQEDADARVIHLKQRMEMLKKRREAKAALGGE
ncbi:hypothetical protein TREMEDRAFT_22984, partial [Tremella mesenterica DSM 1558]|uniref:uncharacterized protein n=1 Tax=Tremella mesenterica (strain ATCC 24925 / CBS 8224 / DSM 1558 / NBRC 9311 / NRRL Y-6157 / RJB 2259-6 / UBC 559-6) TaxID=578456 RepID=UPI0003F49524